MAGVKISSKGVVVSKAGSGLSIDLDLKTSLSTTRVSGSGNAGMLGLGGGLSSTDADRVLLEITGASGEGNRCAILLHSTGSTTHDPQTAGGVVGPTQAPPVGSVYIYTDGRGLFFRNQDGIAQLAFTSSNFDASTY